LKQQQQNQVEIEFGKSLLTSRASPSEDINVRSAAKEVKSKYKI